ncbi:MAG: N-acetyltransferase [Hyphomonadaceae bacterium]|nr:N-acetyltransferase [Hyphomonadaceae bacterium]
MAVRDAVFRDNKALSRFELEIEGESDAGGGVVIADYRRRDAIADIRHVETPVALQGKGLATRLMDEIAAYATAEGLKIRLTCPFAAAYFAARPELQALRA